MPRLATQVHQIARPTGKAGPEHFRFVEVPVPDPGAGELLVENRYLSVDPYMRQLMDEPDGWDLNAPLEGRTVGRVTMSRSPEIPEGSLVLHRHGWQTHAVVPAAGAIVLPDVDIPTTNYLSVLGGTGLTAYVGLTRIAKVRPGDVVFVSAAAGAVGSAVGQFARILGASRVIGSAGSPEKVAHLVDDLGFDAAFDYHDGDLAGQLAAAAPDGIDVYFDNVGGEHLAAAIASSRTHGRFALCGMVAQYDGTGPAAAPYNLIEVVEKALTLEGFLVAEHSTLRDEFIDWATPLLRSGTVVAQETVVSGFDRIITAFTTMLAGGYRGKTIVRV